MRKLQRKLARGRKTTFIFWRNGTNLALQAIQLSEPFLRDRFDSRPFFNLKKTANRTVNRVVTNDNGNGRIHDIRENATQKENQKVGHER